MKKVYLGIDWADDHHDVCQVDENGQMIKSFRISHDIDGFIKLKTYLDAYHPDDILIGIEINHGLLFDYLIENQYHVYVINPGSLAAYRKKFHISHAKNDKIDARSLAQTVRTDRHHFKEYKMDSEIIKRLKLLCDDRQRLLQEKVRLELQLIDALKLYYPVALKLFSDISNYVALAFLETYSNHEKSKAITLPELTEFFKQQHYPSPQQIPEIYQLLQGFYPRANNITVDAKEQFVKVIVPLLRQLRKNINHYDKLIKELYQSHPDKDIFSALPGVADIIGPKLMVCLGDDRNRYDSYHQLQQISGTAPITLQSGKQNRVVLFRFACNKFFRHAMDEMAFSSLRLSPWAKNYYKKQRKNGKTHNMAIRALANKWLRVIFKLWRDRLIYNEDKHLANMVRNLQFVM